VWAVTVKNFVGRRASEDPAGCRALLDELARLHATHADETSLGTILADAVKVGKNPACGSNELRIQIEPFV